MRGDTCSFRRHIPLASIDSNKTSLNRCWQEKAAWWKPLRARILLCDRGLLGTCMLVHLGNGQIPSHILKSCWVQAIAKHFTDKEFESVRHQRKHYKSKRNIPVFALVSQKNTLFHMFYQEYWKSQGCPKESESLLFLMLVNLSIGDPHWPSWHLLPLLPDAPRQWHGHPVGESAETPGSQTHLKCSGKRKVYGGFQFPARHFSVPP